MKKVSIIVPVYNAGAKLSRCIDSIIAQTHERLQIILVNDGSQDDSLAICRQYAEHDSRILVLSHGNRGVSYSRNRGIDAADGDYLTFFDADDSVLPDMVQRYLETAERDGVDAVIGGIRFCPANSEPYEIVPPSAGTVDRKKMIETVCGSEDGIFGYAAGKLYRTSLIKGNGIRFREDMAAQEDLEFALSVYRAGNLFSLFSYCGYLYDYTPSGRAVPVRDLLGNQQNLLKIAEEVNAKVSCRAKTTEHIREMTYIGLFHCKSAVEIEAIAAIPGLKQDAAKYYTASGEQKLVLRLFIAGKNESIYRYFRFRNHLKRLLGKK